MTYIPGGGGGTGSISTSSDVALNNTATGNVLAYDASIAKWRNIVPESTSGGFITVGLPGSGAHYTVDNAAGADIAINRALTDVGIAGSVFLLPGTFSVKAPIVLQDMQALIGCAPHSSMLDVVTGWSGDAVIKTPAGYTGVRNVIRDLGINGHKRVAQGISLIIDDAPSSFGPDPQPWINRVFVHGVTGDGFFLGGTYAGAQREAKVSDCRAQNVGGWGFNIQSSDVFISNCSVQGGDQGGYFIGGGNSKVLGCKAYSCGLSGTSPAPGFKISARGVITGCEAQDNIGNGFEIVGPDANLSGCVADSNGDGVNGNISAGFFISANYCHIEGSSYQRVNGGAIWKVAGAGQMHALRLASGAQNIYAVLSTGSHPSPWASNLSGA
ncbi:hypothetical protein CYG49_02105, partial [Candidatus Saccharibacteria bacterium]